MKPMSAYYVVHYLLRKRLGPARHHQCVECERRAAHWAYDHADVFERFDTENQKVFSVNFDHYRAMCQRCHIRLDTANMPRIAKALEQFQNDAAA